MTELILYGRLISGNLASIGEKIFGIMYINIKNSASPLARFFLSKGFRANDLSILRFGFASLILVLMSFEHPSKYVLIFIITSVGFYSDAIDGQMARISALNVEEKNVLGKMLSPLTIFFPISKDVGKIIDPLADKAFVLSVAFLIKDTHTFLWMAVISIQTVTAIFATCFYVLVKVPVEDLQANNLGKTKIGFYTAGFLICCLQNIFYPRNTTLAFVVFVSIGIGVLFDIASQTKKLKTMRY